MKGLRVANATLALWLAAAPCAFAASTTKVYNSGPLVLIFLGFCALVVVAQLLPALMTLWGMVKGLVFGANKEKIAEAKASK